jgi:hypothetical protein
MVPHAAVGQLSSMADPRELPLPSSDKSSEDGSDCSEESVDGRDRERARVLRPIAGASPGPLESLRSAAEHLEQIVRQWRRPDDVTTPTVTSAEHLVYQIYQILEDWVAQHDEMLAVYEVYRSVIAQDYSRAMDSIWTFMRVLEADEGWRPGMRTPRQEKAAAIALAEARRAMIDAVRSFQAWMPGVVTELERVSKDPFS